MIILRVSANDSLHKIMLGSLLSRQSRLMVLGFLIGCSWTSTELQQTNYGQMRDVNQQQGNHTYIIVRSCRQAHVCKDQEHANSALSMSGTIYRHVTHGMKADQVEEA